MSALASDIPTSKKVTSYITIYRYYLFIQRYYWFFFSFQNSLTSLSVISQLQVQFTYTFIWLFKNPKITRIILIHALRAYNSILFFEKILSWIKKIFTAFLIYNKFFLKSDLLMYALRAYMDSNYYDGCIHNNCSLIQ